MQPEERPPLWVGVPPLPGHFLGREALLDALVRQLTNGQTLALSAEGLPGVGKTTLAVALAYQQKVLDHFSDGVFWAGLGPEGDPRLALTDWGQSLGADLAGAAELADMQRAVQHLIGRRRLLLVIDDAWELEAARALRCGGPNCCYLLTTRDKGLARAYAGATGMTTVPVLADDPAFALLQKLAPEACAHEPEAAAALARAVGGLPLALELLGGYLGAPERHLFPDLSQAALAELADPARRLRLAQQRLGGRGPTVTLAETIQLSLSGLPEGAAQAFYALGAFAPKPESFSRAAAEAVTEGDSALLALLAARNLLERAGGTEEERLALHQTLADAARAEMPTVAQARHRVYYLAAANEDRGDWRRIEKAYGQIKWAWRYAPDDRNLFDFLSAVGFYQYRRGLWRDYIHWAGRALPIMEEVGDRAGLATTLNNIGSVYDSLGQRGKALEYYERALPIREEVGDRYGESITRYNLAMMYRSRGQLAQAVAELKRVVELDRLVQHPDLESDLAMLRQVEEELANQ